MQSTARIITAVLIALGSLVVLLQSPEPPRESVQNARAGDVRQEARRFDELEERGSDRERPRDEDAGEARVAMPQWDSDSRHN